MRANLVLVKSLTNKKLKEEASPKTILQTRRNQAHRLRREHSLKL